MSVAFTREEDLRPPRPTCRTALISLHPNLVTPEGLAQLDAARWRRRGRPIRRADGRGGQRRPHRHGPGHPGPALLYARRASAQLMDQAADLNVVFGATVTFEREDGRVQSFRIVGEDEADPAKGSVSYVSPLARALLGKAVGDEAEVAGASVVITAIDA